MQQFERLAEEVSLQSPNWLCIVIQEMDFLGRHVQSVRSTPQGHQIHRYWPGVGARALGILVNRRWAAHASNLLCMGRSCKISFFERSPLKISVVCSHLPHDDTWYDEVATLCNMLSTDRSAYMSLRADVNCDLFPYNLPSQDQDHAWDSASDYQRILWNKGNMLIQSLSQLRFTNFAQGIPTRAGRCLDWMCFRNAQLDRVLVEKFPLTLESDDESLCARWKLLQTPLLDVQKSSWKCKDPRAWAQDAADTAPLFLRSYDDVCAWLAPFAEGNNEQATRREQRASRESAQIKQLRMECRCALEPEHRQILLQQLHEAVKAEAKSRESSEEASKVDKIQKVIMDHCSFERQGRQYTDNRRSQAKTYDY